MQNCHHTSTVCRATDYPLVHPAALSEQRIRVILHRPCSCCSTDSVAKLSGTLLLPAILSWMCSPMLSLTAFPEERGHIARTGSCKSQINLHNLLIFCSYRDRAQPTSARGAAHPPAEFRECQCHICDKSGTGSLRVMQKRTANAAHRGNLSNHSYGNALFLQGFRHAAGTVLEPRRAQVRTVLFGAIANRILPVSGVS